MKALIALFVLIAIAHCAEIPPFLDGASDEVVGQWIKLQEGFGEMSENQIEAAVDKFIQDHPDYKVAIIHLPRNKCSLL
ncbi:hypothetical protein AB6A40_005006 [Gnathostoma spinigerum]|uniref:Uncharacterized protein n=1 Tax=Gnathostoma spinigerum TaxID=75299 RepID=A0ABD6EGC8_9BILA